jgi:hypothetical protein
MVIFSVFSYLQIEIRLTWLQNDGLWTSTAKTSLEVIMHQCSYYRLHDDGLIIMDNKFRDLMHELRKGSDIHDLDGVAEVRLFHSRVRQQVQSITRELCNLGFVDYDSNGDLNRCRGFDIEWKCRDSHWKRTNRQKLPTGNGRQIYLGKSVAQDTPETAQLLSSHGITLSLSFLYKQMLTSHFYW